MQEENAVELKEKVVAINRVAKVVKGGRTFRFSALVVVGDGNGHVGVGNGKAAEVPDAIKKAIDDARKNLKEVPVVGTTIPHEFIGKFGSARVMLKPAVEGSGVIAGGSARAVLELAGYKDIKTKVLGTNNPRNVVYATMNGLENMRTVEQIAKKGIKEVVLTGIHIASYGKENKENNYFLIDLLEDLNKIQGIERIRLGSLEPTIITEEFAKRLSKLEKICNQFHLSLQSGCDETLKRMNRKYTTKQFEEVAQILRKYFKDVNLTTDIIVGFPGETDEEFEQTYNFLKNISFYKMHIFKYSPREGTLAQKMSMQVDGNKKEERSEKLIELSNINQEMYNKKYINKKIMVLFEEKVGDYWEGYTKNYIRLKVKTEENLENKLQEVVPIKEEKQILIAKI